MKIKKPICGKVPTKKIAAGKTAKVKNKFTKRQALKIIDNYNKLVADLSLATQICKDKSYSKQIFKIWNKLQKMGWIMNELVLYADK